jgi:hypothetical protein
LGKILGFYKNDEDSSLLVYDVLSIGKDMLTFLGRLLSLSSKSYSPRSLNCEVAGNKLLGNVGHSLPVNKALDNDMPQQLVATLSAEVHSQAHSRLYRISG